MSKTILFQGDSITDAGRAYGRESYYDSNYPCGTGYPMLVKAALGCDAPGEYVFYNRGVGGDRVADLYARIKRDVINLRPDYMSVLIGVNDVWHDFQAVPNGTTNEKYERIYRLFLREVTDALPDIRIMILEPYVLCASATCNTPEMPDRWDRFSSRVFANAQSARRIAEDLNFPFVPLQEPLEKASEKTGVEYWLADGVHPTAMGHELIKRAWLDGFQKLSR